MIYHLMSTLDCLVKKTIIDMGIYPYGRQTAALKSAFATHKENPELKWLGETFLYFLIKQDIRQSKGHSLLPTVCSPYQSHG
jgi:hypothetical protein